MVETSKSISLGSTDRTKLKRIADKASVDVDELFATLDNSLVAHVGIVFEGNPLVIPMALGRVGDVIYLHGSSGSRLMRALADSPQVCVSVTELLGLKVARSTFNSGMHYRSAVIFGRASLVPDSEKDMALDAISESLIPGRPAEVRKSLKRELAATVIISLPLTEASLKVSLNEVEDEPEDLNQGVWAGIIPLKMTAGQPISADAESSALGVPQSIEAFVQINS